MLNSLRQDVVLALRQLRVRPWFALLIVATLGSAIGVNASVFTVFNWIVYQPWPVRDPARVRHVMATATGNPFRPPGDDDAQGVSLAEWRQVAARTKALSGLAAMDLARERVDVDDGHAYAYFVSANFFDVMGVPMEHGRSFLPHEDGTDEPGTNALLAYRAWRRLFGADPSIVGRTVKLDGMPFTVIGVVSRGFTTSAIQRREADVWLPLPARALWNLNSREAPRDFLTNPRRCCAWVTGRLAPGVTTEAATAEIQTLSRDFRAAAGLEPLRLDLRGTSNAELGKGQGWRGRGVLGFAARFALFFVAVLLVLLLACANAGNLLLARGYARRQEIAVRLSLGAGRARIVRQLLTEALVLALVAGVVGLVIASVLPEAFVSTVSEGAGMTFRIDRRVYLYAFALVVLSCVACALAPALHVTRVSISGTLKDAHAGGPGRFSLRGLLLGAQVAICVVLLVGAGLMTRSVWHALAKDLGFESEGVRVVSFDPPFRKYDPKRVAAFVAQFRAEAEGLADGRRLAVTASVPLEKAMARMAVTRKGPAREYDVGLIATTPRYFEVLQLPLSTGRTFAAADPPLGVVIVNEELARRHWPGENVLGKTIMLKSPIPGPREVIGVAKDAYMTTASDMVPTVYIPMVPAGYPRVLVREEGNALVTAVGAIGRRLDPEMRVQVRSVRDPLQRQLELTRLAATIAACVGLLALALATFGLFGVFAYSVQQRTRELGIRIALGAEAMHVVRFVLGTATRALVGGLVTGLAVALAASRVLDSVLYGLSPLDPLTYVGVVAVLLLAGLTATYLPARRALRVDPTVALRYE